MHSKLSPIVVAALLLSASYSNAQDGSTQSECKPSHSTKPPPSTRILRPDVNVVCGANSVNQTFSSQVNPENPILSHTKRQDDSLASPSLLVALVTGAAGVLGAFAGALASYLVARAKAKSDLELETKRLSANVIATERLRWLQDIRQRLSTFFQQLDLQYNLLKRPLKLETASATQQQLDEMSSEVMAQCNMITLMLNPTKPDQAELGDSLQRSLKFVQLVFQQVSIGAPAFDDTQYSANKQAAFDAMTRVGVETWRQVKSLA